MTKITEDMKRLIRKWLKFSDPEDYNHITGKGPLKKWDCPMVLERVKPVAPNHRYCIACRKAFDIAYGCPCIRLGVQATEKRAREILELEEI